MTFRYLKRWRAVLLLLILAVVVWLMFVSTNITKDIKEKMFQPKMKSHVSFTFGQNLQGDQFLSEALKQIQQQLAGKRDVMKQFDESTLSMRKDHVSSVCSVLKEDTERKRGALYYKKSNVLYCDVSKVACKFMSRLFQVMENSDLISPYNFEKPSRPLPRLQLKDMSEPKAKSQRRNVTNSALKVVFSRNPYKRLFSAYVDKLVGPCSRFWDLGRGIVSFVRNSPSKRSLRCGHDVQFNEVVKFLLAHDPKGYDDHFKPVSVVCNVCHDNYDVIGKVETIKHDVMYLLNKTGASEKIFFNDFTQENKVHYIIFEALQAFEYKVQTLKCITVHAMHRRLWRSLQISGLIDKHDNYPLTPEESRQANQTTIINLLLGAHYRSTSGARSNSKEAFLQAYSQVSAEDMEKLRLKYLKDFMLFEYDDRPDELFRKREMNEERNGFDYFDILELN